MSQEKAREQFEILASEAIRETLLTSDRLAHEVLADHLQKAYRAGLEEAASIATDEITSSTGPTGGWLDSPKAVADAIRQRVEEHK